MFKSVQNRVWVFDAEWVPDPVTGRLVYDLPAELEDGEVIEEMWRRGGADGETPRPYLKTVLCRLVSIAVMTRSSEEGEPPLRLFSLPPLGDESADFSEAEIIDRFLDGVGKRQPQLVGFNSRAADFAILLQRAVVNGVRAPGFARRPDKPWEGVDYFAGGEWHVDLIDILGVRGRSRPSLNEMATACGIPGKFSGGGSDVVDLWMKGEIEEIVRYNEFDAITTYLLWLRLAHLGGFFSSEGYQREQELLEEFLRDEATKNCQSHLKEYLTEWLRLRHYGGRRQLNLGF